MATAKRVGEIQALSFSVSHRGEDLGSPLGPVFSGKDRIGAEPTSKISHSAIPNGFRWRPTRTGPLPSSRCPISQTNGSLVGVNSI